MTDASSRFGWLRGASDPASVKTRRKWSVVGASGLLTGVGHGFVQFAVSALLKPIAADLDMSRAGVSSAISLGRLVQGVMSLLAGHSVDQWGARRVVAAGTMVMALGLAAMSFVTSPLMLYIAWGIIISAGTSFAFTVAMDRTVVANADEGRGVALAARFTIIALVTTVQVPLIVWLVESFGWRMTCLVWGGVMLLTLPLPLMLFEDEGLKSRAQSDAEPEPRMIRSVTLRAAIKTRTYWILALAYMTTAGTISGVSVHSVPMLTDRGFSIAMAGVVFGGLVLVSIPARLLTGFYSDRLRPELLPRIFGLVLIAESVAFASEAYFGTVSSLFAMLIAKGIATGVPTVLVVIIILSRFGKDSLGAIQGSLMLLQVPGTMAGPVLAGLAHDLTGSYSAAIALFAALLLLSGCALQFANTKGDAEWQRH